MFDTMMTSLVTLEFWVPCVLLFVQSAISGTEDDAEECGSDVFGQVRCSSATFYTECPIPGAITVRLIKLHRNLSAAPCDFKTTFGYRANMVWVTGGCSGEFFICYEGDIVSQSTRTPNPTPGITAVNPGTPGSANTTGPSGVVVKGSNLPPESRNVAIYIVLAVSITVIVGSGVLIGYIAIGWLQRDKSKRILKSRQTRMRNVNDNGVTITTINETTGTDASARLHKPVNEIGKADLCNERSETMRSSESGNSGRNSSSGRWFKSRNKKPKHVSFTMDGSVTSNRTCSVPNIIKVGTMSENGTLYTGNHINTPNERSSGNINETRNINHNHDSTERESTPIYTVPIRLTTSSSQKVTNSHSGRSCSPMENKIPVAKNTCQTKTRAIVHVQPRIFSQPENEVIDNDENVNLPQATIVVPEFEPHYADPDTLIHIGDLIDNANHEHNFQNAQTNVNHSVENQTIPLADQKRLSGNLLRGQEVIHAIYSKVNKSVRTTTTYSEHGTTQNAEAIKRLGMVQLPIVDKHSKNWTSLQAETIEGLTMRPAIKPKPLLKPKPLVSRIHNNNKCN